MQFFYDRLQHVADSFAMEVTHQLQLQLHNRLHHACPQLTHLVLTPHSLWVGTWRSLVYYQASHYINAKKCSLFFSFLRNMELTGGAMEAISEFYSELRANSEHLTLPITVRTLETIIRLSTAAAKARMSEEGVEQVSQLPLQGLPVGPVDSSTQQGLSSDTRLISTLSRLRYVI